MDEENVRVDRLITELDAMRRDRDDALAKPAEAVRLREEDGALRLAVESDLRKMTARADNLGIEMQGWKARAEKAEGRLRLASAVVEAAEKLYEKIMPLSCTCSVSTEYFDVGVALSAYRKEEE